MTMHLARGLTTTGKRRGKQKFASAEAKRQHQQLQQDWEALKSKWGADSTKKSKKVTSVTLPTAPGPAIRRDDNNPKVSSLNSWHTGAVSSKQTPQYTGNKVLGVTVVHKSCLQPVFSQQEAIDAAKMRR